MKRIAVFFVATVMALACNVLNPSDMVLRTEDFDLEGQYWAVSGIQAPYGQQEIVRMHYKGPDGYLVPAEFQFSGGKVTVVFPSGAYRTIGYTLDTKARTISFDAPLSYGCEVTYNGEHYVGENIRIGKYEMMKIGRDGLIFSFFDPSADSYSDVSLENQQWGLSLVNLKRPSITPLYEIAGEYGTMQQGNNFNTSGAPFWSIQCIYTNAVFPWIDGEDLSSVHYGPEWRNPTEAEAKWLLDNCVLCGLATTIAPYDPFGFVFGNKVLYMPIPPLSGEQVGFWLSNGKVLVYNFTNAGAPEANIITPEPDAKYFLRPVRRQ